MSVVIKKRWDGTDLPACSQTTVSFVVLEDSLRICIDAPFFNDARPPPNATDLWNFEVVEVFIKGRFDKYIEIEVGSHADYLILLCDGYRQCFIRRLDANLCTAQILNNRWIGEIEIPNHYLPPPTELGYYTCNAFSIHGEREYCAAFPPSSSTLEPDFHKLELFEKLPVHIPAPKTSIWGDRQNFSLATMPCVKPDEFAPTGIRE